MNESDRQKISRIRSALAEVPFAQDGSGTKTASVNGFVSFQKDMRVVRTACEEALFLLACPDPDLSKADNDREFECAVKVAEDWIEKRSAVSWR